jgi:drug/metabolite transporter (DMT)-like permease
MVSLTRKQLLLLIALTLVWGHNWLMLKIGVSHYPPLSFRCMSMLIGWPLLGLVVKFSGLSFRVPRSQWRELFVLTLFNLLIWHALIVFAVRDLSSGRAGILGYTMPVFSALFGLVWYRTRLHAMGWLGLMSWSASAANLSV